MLLSVLSILALLAALVCALFAWRKPAERPEMFPLAFVFFLVYMILVAIPGLAKGGG